jgi:hypothetical protein
MRTYQRSTEEGALVRGMSIAVLLKPEPHAWPDDPTIQGSPALRDGARRPSVFEKKHGRIAKWHSRPRSHQAKLCQWTPSTTSSSARVPRAACWPIACRPDGKTKVLVLEAGGSDNKFWIKTPIGYGRTFADAAVNWKYQAQPSPGLNGRGMYWPRGRVVGGSSSINALVYCRGMPQDFDDWRDMGHAGWGWEDVRPYFEKTERRVDSSGRATTDGALDVKDVTPFLHPMRSSWLSAARELNLPVTDDFNGANPEGFGCYQVTIRNGKRVSAADAFLRPALRRAQREARNRRLGQQDSLLRGPRRGRGLVARRSAVTPPRPRK